MTNHGKCLFSIFIALDGCRCLDVKDRALFWEFIFKFNTSVKIIQKSLLILGTMENPIKMGNLLPSWKHFCFCVGLRKFFEMCRFASLFSRVLFLGELGWKPLFCFIRFLFLVERVFRVIGVYWDWIGFCWVNYLIIQKHRAANGWPKSTEIIFWKSFDFLAWVRSPGWQISFFTFLFNLTQLELRIIPVQKFRQNIE